MINKHNIRCFSLSCLLALSIHAKVPKQSSVSDSKVKTSLLLLDDYHSLRNNFYKIKYQESDCRWDLDGKITYTYQQTFNNDKIAPLFLQYNPILIKNVNTDAEKYLTALQDRNFGFALPQGEPYAVCFKPKIQNHIIDLSATLNWYTDCSSFYIHAGLPIVRTDWDLKTNSKNITSEDLGYDSLTSGDYDKITQIDTNTTSTNFTIGTFLTAIVDKKTITPASPSTPAASLFDALGGYIVSDLAKKEYGNLNINGRKQCDSKWDVANLILQTGWNAIQHENSHLGIYLKAGIPLGTELNKCWAKYTFSPVVGNGKRWEFGLGLNSHMSLKNTDCYDLTLHADGYVSHVFKKNRTAIFDLKNKPMTRYNLVKAFKETGDTNAPYAYADILSTVADIGAQCINVSIPVRGEAVIAFNYARHCWNMDLGYSFLGEQAEKSSCVTKIKSNYKYALLGGADVEAWDSTNAIGNTITGNNKTATYSTQYIEPNSSAYLIKQNNTPYSHASWAGNDIFAGTEITGIALNNHTEYLLTNDDLNISSALMDAKILHKLFANFEYIWHDTCYTPKIGISASIGFSPRANYTPEMWDVGIYLGGSY
jgi:hypothetical protein